MVDVDDRYILANQIAIMQTLALIATAVLHNKQGLDAITEQLLKRCEITSKAIDEASK